MQEHGLKISELVTLFNLEVLNRGSDYDTALLTITDVNRPGLQFHSFYDYFDPRRLQVLGKAEITYLKGLTTEQRRKCFDDLFLYDIPALVISRGLDCFPECLESARVHERTLLRTEETTVEFTSHTIEYLNRVLAPCVTRHGVLLDISGEGVMITGDSGIGKSESAIELIMRGHRLVADDAVEIRRISNQLIGTAPEVIRHYIELRGIGVIDVRQLFGMSAIMEESRIDLVVQFEQWDETKFYDRLGIEDHPHRHHGRGDPLRHHPGAAGPEPGQHRGGGGHEQPPPALRLQRRPGAGPAGGPAGGAGQPETEMSGFFIGIDVGGTNLKAGLTDETGRLLAAARRPLDFRGAETFAADLAESGGGGALHRRSGARGRRRAWASACRGPSPAERYCTPPTSPWSGRIWRPCSAGGWTCRCCWATTRTVLP